MPLSVGAARLSPSPANYLLSVNTELEDILTLLEELYNIAFQVGEKRILNCRFTGEFDNAKLEDVLKTLAFSMDIKFT